MGRRLDTTLDELATVAGEFAALHARQDLLVGRARHAGATWAQVAEALGVSVQAAHKRYRDVKLATLAVALVYVVLVEQSLFGAVLVMMSVRVAAAIGLCVVIQRHTGITLPVGWLLRFGVLWVATASVGLVVSMGVGGHVADVPLVAAVVIVLGIAGVRMSGLLTAEDLALVNRVLPEAARLTDSVAFAIGAGRPS
jgi:hypothetical protein